MVVFVLLLNLDLVAAHHGGGRLKIEHTPVQKVVLPRPANRQTQIPWVPMNERNTPWVPTNEQDNNTHTLGV